MISQPCPHKFNKAAKDEAGENQVALGMLAFPLVEFEYLFVHKETLQILTEKTPQPYVFLILSFDLIVILGRIILWIFFEIHVKTVNHTNLN